MAFGWAALLYGPAALRCTGDFMRRIACWLVSMVLLGAALAGCQGGGDAAVAKPPKPGPYALPAADAAYDRGEYELAYIKYLPLAEAGEVRAQIRLGKLLYEGLGTPKDYAEAARWWRRAADTGNASAATSLGFLYTQGHGVPQDYAEAARWYRMSATLGDDHGQFDLGNAYRNGRGVKQDQAEAAYWYRLAAGQGYAAAQFNLGIMYAAGEGVEQSRDEAVNWYRLAANQGHAAALNNLGWMYWEGEEEFRDPVKALALLTVAAERGSEHASLNRANVAATMTPRERAEARLLANEWRERIAAWGG